MYGNLSIHRDRDAASPSRNHDGRRGRRGHRGRGHRRLGHRARAALTAILLGSALLGGLVVPAGGLAERMASAAAERLERVDSALESIGQVEGLLRRDERREFSGR